MWLQTNAQPSDRVVVHMDLGTGRDFEVLQALLESQSLTLIDQIQVQWHYQAEVCIAAVLSILNVLVVHAAREAGNDKRVRMLHPSHTVVPQTERMVLK